jgi:4Fe-4S ferredoxin
VDQTDNQPCKHPPGVMVPVIDRNRCEGKAACVSVCPTNVFVVGVLPAEQRRELTLMGRLKGFGHGWKQAFTPNAAACEGCAKCVEACPESAIRLARAGKST